VETPPPKKFIHEWEDRVVRRDPSLPVDGTPSAADAVAPAGGASSDGVAARLARGDPSAQRDFVELFMAASSYIAGHAGRTFVVVLPGEVFADPSLYGQALEDVALLDTLGVHVVVVCGSFSQLQARLARDGVPSRFEGGYRVTCPASLRCALEAAGEVRWLAEGRLSRGPSVAAVRRHERGAEPSSPGDKSKQFHFKPVVRVATTNAVVGRRRGVVDGVDFGDTGEVRLVCADEIRSLLDSGHVVLVSNIATSVDGETLNCNVYDVAVSTATALRAGESVGEAGLGKGSGNGAPPRRGVLSGLRGGPA